MSYLSGFSVCKTTLQKRLVTSFLVLHELKKQLRYIQNLAVARLWCFFVLFFIHACIFSTALSMHSCMVVLAWQLFTSMCLTSVLWPTRCPPVAHAS